MLRCGFKHDVKIFPLLPMAPPPQLVLAASSADAGVAAWDLRSGGAEAIRLRTCASPPHSLADVAGRFLAAAQFPASSSSAPIHYYHWDKPQVAVKSFPAEPIRALIADTEGNYLIGGGGASGDIFLWEVASGELLIRWHAHYRAVRCLALYDMLLVSGSEDGSIKVWDLLMMLDEEASLEVKTPYLYSFNQHTLPVTAVACGHGAIAISSSEDRTCKIWSLYEGRILRSISFPAIIDSVALDPRGHILYAGARDGKIYVTAIGVDFTSHGNAESSILGAFNDHSKAVTSLAVSTDGLLLVSGSEDGDVRAWDTRSQQVTRKFKHSQGPVTNVLIVMPRRVNLPPLQSLRKVCSPNGEAEAQAVILSQPQNDNYDARCFSSDYLESYLNTLEENSSSMFTDFGVIAVSGQQQSAEWKQKYLELQNLFVHEVLDEISSAK